jgi:FkbM family methyltransferase
MSAILRRVAKWALVLLWGKEFKPRRIVRGIASGYRICVSPQENLGYLIGMDETHLQRAIRKYVSAGDTVYDIGANVGYVSLCFAKRVGTGGRVFAFEPVPRNIEAFRRNIDINCITQVRLLEAAAAEKAGEALIRIAGNLSTASLVWHQNNPSATEISVRTVSIDELVDAGQLGSPKFIKIDVEGAEGAVLQGMRRTVASARPVLFVECSEAGREKAWNLLQDLDYRCQSAITGEWIDTFEKYRHSDFLWIPAPVHRDRIQQTNQDRTSA